MGWLYHCLVLLKMTGMMLVVATTFVKGFALRSTFKTGILGKVNLVNGLEGDICLPLRDHDCFRHFRVDPAIHRVLWENGADFTLN